MVALPAGTPPQRSPGDNFLNFQEVPPPLNGEGIIAGTARIMKNYIIGVTAISLLSIWFFLPTSVNHPSSIWAAQELLLADKHKNAGITCDVCHEENPPIKRVPMGVCTRCHGDYDKVIELTQKSRPNPHDSHVGELECDACHYSHKPFENYCARCHDFELKVKGKGLGSNR